MKKYLYLILLLMLFSNFLFALKSDFFKFKENGVVEHYSFRGKVYIFYNRGVHLDPPDIYIYGDVFEYGVDVHLNSSIYRYDYGGHWVEGSYFDSLYALLVFSPFEGRNWVYTTFECYISAEVFGAEIAYTYDVKLNSSFVQNLKLKTNYSSPFNNWFRLVASLGAGILLPSWLRFDFVREGYGINLDNSSERTVIEVPKDGFLGLWNFTMVIKVKNIEFKGKLGEGDSHILIISSINIRTYEVKEMIDYFLLTLWILNLALILILAVALFKGKRIFS